MGESGRRNLGREHLSGPVVALHGNRRPLRALALRSTARSARLRHAPPASKTRSTAASSPLRPTSIISSTTESTIAVRTRQLDPGPTQSSAASEAPRTTPRRHRHRPNLATAPFEAAGRAGSVATSRRLSAEVAVAVRIPGQAPGIAFEAAARTGIAGRASVIDSSQAAAIEIPGTAIGHRSTGPTGGSNTDADTQVTTRRHGTSPRSRFAGSRYPRDEQQPPYPLLAAEVNAQR